MKSSSGREAFVQAVVLVALATAIGRAQASERVLFDFTRNLDLPPPAVASDAEVRAVRAPSSALRVITGHQQQWPGITLAAPAGHWDLSSFAQISTRLRNGGTNAVEVFCRVDNPGADGTEHCVTGSVKLAGNEAGTLNVQLRRTSGDTLNGKLFGMRGYPAKTGGPGTVDPSNITQVLFFVTKPKAAHQFDIETVKATGTYVPPTALVSDAESFFPFIDTFGQYRHKDWPGKVVSMADLKSRRQKEATELERQKGPTDWDEFGGWAKGPKLGSTGYFRTQKLGQKWWLVDPAGHAFFSHGIDCVRALDTTPIEQRDAWFEDFPGKNQEFASFFSSHLPLKGYYAGRTVQCFSFGGANLLRKYGPDWPKLYPQLIHRRLRNWGLNTIANWSEESLCSMRLTPYTDSIGSGQARMLSGSEGYWGKFPDVFDPSFAQSVRQSMEFKRGKSAGDPWCIGYFCDNEMSWGDELSLSLAALRSGPDQPAKKAFIELLEKKYGDVAELNRTWGTSFGSWKEMLEQQVTPDQQRASDDLKEFYTKTAEQYFRQVREAVKAVAPHQLYLGCRFAWVNDRAAAAAAKYCDVVSYNLYRRSVADFKFNGGADVPLLIGEFHFGALDRGMFHPGLVPVTDQEVRGEAYLSYVQGALHHPQFVGCHWFQYFDEPNTGRAYDEENYQIGFVDVADSPYPETIAACREAGYHLYSGIVSASH